MNIVMDSIYKSFNKVEVIKNLSLEIRDNDLTTLLGPSGCGKTTILRMIAGLEKPDYGEIWFDDICVFSSKNRINILPEKRNIGFVFQDFALWPHLSVFENVAFGLRAKKDTARLKERVNEALELVQLADYKDRYPSQLSGGQQQRVGFARAIVTKPDCILFDEPLSALDAILREDMRLEIKGLIEKLNTTAVFVTHDQMEAMSMSDWIVVMNKGRIEQQGKPENIYQRPETHFIAKFIGKSNWIESNKMFRPETAVLKQKDGYKEFPAVVSSIEFLGEKYNLYLNVKGQRWTVESFSKYNIGSELSVYVNEEDIVTI